MAIRGLITAVGVESIEVADAVRNVATLTCNLNISLLFALMVRAGMLSPLIWLTIRYRAATFLTRWLLFIDGISFPATVCDCQYSENGQ